MQHRTLSNGLANGLANGPLAIAFAVAAGLGLGTDARAAAVFVNEFHYDNNGADTDELVEVAGPAGTDLDGWTVVFYNGSSGEDYATLALGGVLPDQSEGLGTLSFATSGVQNGAPDGLALVSDLGAVEQFLSYEGAFAATAGPAAGLTSSDIGVAELGTEAPGLSLQLTGAGRVGADFVWSGPAPASPGELNLAQTVTPVVPLPPSVLGLLGALGVLAWRRACAGGHNRVIFGNWRRLARRSGPSALKWER